MNKYFDIILTEINDCDMCSYDMSYILGACDFAYWTNHITFAERSQLLDIAIKKYNLFINSSKG